VEALFETPRLRIRRAQPGEADAAFFLRLWNDPRVMRNVGFPYGLRLDAADVRQVLERGLRQGDERQLDACLVAVRKDTCQVIGECKLGTPDAQGLSETDVKLLPEFWGQGYGTEIKRGLLAYLFTHTECRVVQATPNVDNPASIRMQEAVGGRRVGESTHEFPPDMRSFTRPVRCHISQVRREGWLKDHPPGTR
jgi:RimJ/RimL family protein N-acetyltransferase